MGIREQFLMERKALGMIQSWVVMAEGLEAEIIEGLRFFLESDIKVQGYIGQGAVEAFKTQGVVFPKILVEFVK